MNLVGDQVGHLVWNQEHLRLIERQQIGGRVWNQVWQIASQMEIQLWYQVQREVSLSTTRYYLNETR